MKFLVSSSTLLRHLQATSGILSSTSTLPILNNFLFEVDEQRLKITTSDLETTMSSELVLEKAESGGSVAIPARLLLDTLKTFAEQPLSFSIDEDSFSIEITSENGKFKLIGQNGDDFPRLPAMDGASSVEMSSDALYSAVEKTLFATSTDTLRPIMCGININMEEESTTFAATDAHKLVRYTRVDAVSDQPASITLPKKPMNLLKNLLPDAESNVTIQFNDTNASFAFDEIKLTCRLIEGKYPDYDAVIPKDNPNKLIVERNAILNSVRRVSIFSNKSTYQVVLKIAGSELQIFAEDLDFSNEANERLTCNYEGEDMEIGFNSRFLAEILGNLESDNVIIELSEPTRAGIILPEENSDENENILMLIMPVVINR